MLRHALFSFSSWFGCFFPALSMKLPVRGFINIIRETVAGNYVGCDGMFAIENMIRKPWY